MIDFVDESKIPDDPEEVERTARQRKLYSAVQTIATRTTEVRERLHAAWKNATKEYPNSEGHDFHVLLRGALMPFEEVTRMSFDECMKASKERAANIRKTSAEIVSTTDSGDTMNITPQEVDRVFMEMTVKPVLLAPKNISIELLDTKDPDINKYFQSHPEVKADFETLSNQVRKLVKELDLSAMTAALGSPLGYRSR